MKGSRYAQDGLLDERSSENVTLSTLCSQRKLIDCKLEMRVVRMKIVIQETTRNIYQYLTGS